MSQRARVLGPLGRRLLAAFAAVSLSAVGLVAMLSVRAVQTETVGLEAGQRERAEQAIVAALAHAYRVAGSWPRADLTLALTLAQAAGLQVVVLDATGGPVARLEPTPEPTKQAPRPGRTPSSGSDTPFTTDAPTSAPSGLGSPPPATSGPGRGRGSPGAGQPGQLPGSGNGRAGQTRAQPTPPWISAAPIMAAPISAAPISAAPIMAVPITAAPIMAVPIMAVPITAVAIMAVATPQVTAAGAGIPVVVDAVTVGRALIELAPQAPIPAEAARQAILRTVGWAALAAAVLTVLVSFLATRRVTRPLVALTAAARAVERGDPGAGRLLRPGPGELGELSAAFAQMAASMRRTEKLRRTMAADVAHELRTPVTILRGSTEEMLDGLAPVTREAVASLHEEVLRLERLVEDLAALSAAEAAGLSLRLAPVDLGGLARRAVAQLRTRLAEAGQSATVTVDEDGRPLMVNGDTDRLTQVVTNLLVNAIAYTPPGGRIGVDVRQRGDRVDLTVTDTGPGISPAVLPHVFERFYRGTSAAGRQGTGIGLAVVAELVSAHGGAVSVASPPGRGAVFTMLLPGRWAPSPVRGEGAIPPT